MKIRNPLIIMGLALFLAGFSGFFIQTCRAQDSEIEQMEKRTFELINQERIKAGIEPLKLEDKAYSAARAHSEDMASRGFMGHVCPDGHSLTHRLQKLDFEFINTTWGENVASNWNHRDPPLVSVNGWMNSPGHKKNILNPKFQYSGIGIAKDKNNKYYFTQVFWGKI